MALRGTEQFSFILTSDGSMDIYPDNKTSSFQILLKKPLELGDEDWEIALMSINYPYSWTNVGPSAKVYMRYYIDSKSGPQVMNFPNWQCQSMQEVIDFMTKEMILKSVDADSSIFFGLDELGRFKVSTSSPTCDIGFSNNLLKLLGLGGHPQVQYMTISAFDERQAQRHMLDRIWHEDNLFDFGDEELKNKILYCEDLIECSRILSPFINYEKNCRFF